MSKSHLRERSINSFKRQSGQRVNKAILIVCEGATEAVYFDHLRQMFHLTLVEVQIEGKDNESAPISVVNKAIERVDDRHREAKKAQRHGSIWADKPLFDEVWCIFDVERAENNASFYQGVQKAQYHQFYLALSNPAFEYWFLLHFTNTTRPFANADEVIKELNIVIREFNKNLSKDKVSISEYPKKETKFIRDLLPKFVQSIFPQVEQALARAAKTMPERISNTPPNPSMGVGKLVETLKAMKRY